MTNERLNILLNLGAASKLNAVAKLNDIKENINKDGDFLERLLLKDLYGELCSWSEHEYNIAKQNTNTDFYFAKETITVEEEVTNGKN